MIVNEEEMNWEWLDSKVTELKGICEVAMKDLDELEIIVADVSRRIDLARQRLGNSQ
jgi:hypothetical protein